MKFERRTPGAGGAVERHGYLRASDGTTEVILQQAQGSGWLELEAISTRILGGRQAHPKLYETDKLTLHCRLHPESQFYCKWQQTDDVIHLAKSDYEAFLDGRFPECC